MNCKGIAAVAKTIRSLSIDAIQKANSGHPGLPLGCAELAAVLYGEILKHNPADSKWADRDRFVLSAGHGSMLLYSILHLAGYKITLEDIKNFRQIGSVCCGHPEYGITDGVENTSGPLGQGIALAVGMALAETMLAAKYNTASHKIVDHYTYALVGEGCLEEGVSSEACSFAGHNKLGKLIVFYDENRISIDGSTDITFTEDIGKRYEAYGWQVLKGDMYDVEKIVSLVEEAKKESDKPTLIMLKSVIGKCSPKAGTSAVHGEPLGVEAVAETKKNLGLDPEKFFQIDEDALSYFAEKKSAFAKLESDWQAEFDAWAKENPELAKQWKASYEGSADGSAEDPTYEVGKSVATRTASGDMISTMGLRYSYLAGGSADLKGSNKSGMKCDGGTYTPENRAGRSIEFGIREFGMASEAAGMSLHGGIRPFCATYLVFSDYMRPSIRLAALMKQPVIYDLTHDSIYLGEDGPTHQPIEQLSSLRSIPNLQVLRPGDAEETVEAWHIAMASKDHPVLFSLTRQNVPVYAKEDKNWRETIKKGAYVVKGTSDNPDVTVVATGSEVNMALEAAAKVSGKSVRVVSMLDKNLFEAQSEEFQKQILGSKRVIIAEAGVKTGWEGYVSSKKDLFTIDRFGESGPANKVAEHFGFTAAKLAELIEA
ncbi:MAG: transketolase [Treponema sp.]|uniref:transketolase n=1 Tax=Treponema sp. TaxID=166 RepID=UPI001B7B5A41|nr:transketolase [Treponema sp.]MBP3771900.1 transketolase [Treponema sp.]MBQ9281880.1 transketolase [Treponema sp.]